MDLFLLDQDNDHSRLAPSSSHRWVECPGSARAIMPDTGGEAADRGTLAHGCGSSVLLQDQSLMPDLSGLTEEERDEMDKAVGVYVRFIREEVKKLHNDGEWHQCIGHVERKIHSKIVADFGGTLDYLLVADDYLHVVDFKYGMYPVAAGCTQLRCYLWLANELFPGRKEFHATIVQPRVSIEPKHAQYSLGELEDFFMRVIEASASSEIRPGGHCRWCPFLQTCEPANREAADMAARDFDDLDVDRWLKIIDFAPTVKRLDGLARAALRNYLLDGNAVDGYKLVKQFGRRKWAKPFADIVAAFGKLGISRDEVVVEKLISPAKAEKIATRESIKDLWSKPDKGLTLARTVSDLEEVTDDFDLIDNEENDDIFG